MVLAVRVTRERRVARENLGAKSYDTQGERCGSMAKQPGAAWRGAGAKAKCGAAMIEARGIILKRLAQGTRGEKRYGFGGAGNAGAAGCKGKSRR